MRKYLRAYSLIELILVVVFIGIFSAIAIPRINFAIIFRQEVDTVAKKVVIDLRRTRVLAITDAANNSDGFVLEMTDSGPYTGYEIINDDTGDVVDTHTFGPDIACTGDDRFEFGPLGNLLSGSGTVLNIASEGRSFTIDIISATGTVICTEN
jgi:type II secretory pathway pseudopilin PulG